MTSTIPIDIESAGEDVVLFYLYLVEEKHESPMLSEMLALRSPPRIMTDDVVLGGMRTISDMFHRDPVMTERLCRIAMKRGYRPRPSDVYLSSVANCEGDPHAFINHGQGRGDLRKTLEKRGYETGSTTSGNDIVPIAKVREPEQDPYENVTKLSPKLRESIRKRKIKQNPDLKHKNQRELREQIVDQHGKQ
jgi:hypothetical protein